MKPDLLNIISPKFAFLRRKWLRFGFFNPYHTLLDVFGHTVDVVEHSNVDGCRCTRTNRITRQRNQLNQVRAVESNVIWLI